MTTSKRRGLGFSSYRPYGFVRVPALSAAACSYLSVGLTVGFALSSFAPLTLLWPLLFAGFL
jgi:hypothetical protein